MASEDRQQSRSQEGSFEGELDLALVSTSWWHAVIVLVIIIAAELSYRAERLMMVVKRE